MPVSVVLVTNRLQPPWPGASLEARRCVSVLQSMEGLSQHQRRRMEDRIIGWIHNDERSPVVPRGRQHGLGLGWIKCCQGLPTQARFIDAATSEYGRAGEISLWIG